MSYLILTSITRLALLPSWLERQEHPASFEFLKYLFMPNADAFVYLWMCVACHIFLIIFVVMEIKDDG